MRIVVSISVRVYDVALEELLSLVESDVVVFVSVTGVRFKRAVSFAHPVFSHSEEPAVLVIMSGQVSQCVASDVVLNVPASHSIQVTLPDQLLYCPGEH